MGGDADRAGIVGRGGASFSEINAVAIAVGEGRLEGGDRLDFAPQDLGCLGKGGFLGGRPVAPVEHSLAIGCQEGQGVFGADCGGGDGPDCDQVVAVAMGGLLAQFFSAAPEGIDLGEVQQGNTVFQEGNFFAGGIGQGEVPVGAGDRDGEAGKACPGANIQNAERIRTLGVWGDRWG